MREDGLSMALGRKRSLDAVIKLQLTAVHADPRCHDHLRLRLLYIHRRRDPSRRLEDESPQAGQTGRRGGEDQSMASYQGFCGPTVP